MLKSLKKFIIFLKKINKEGSILEIFAGFNSKTNKVRRLETWIPQFETFVNSVPLSQNSYNSTSFCEVIPRN